MFFKRKLDKCVVYCLERNTHIFEEDGKNKFSYEFIFSVVEPTDFTRKSWSEHVDNANLYEVDKYYNATYNSKTGEMNILDERT